MNKGKVEEIIKRLPGKISPGLGLVLVEEMGREVAEGLKEAIPARLREKTESLTLKEHRIEGTEVVVDVPRRGSLKELLIISPSKEFEVVVFADGIVKLRGTYEELMNLSPYLGMLEALPELDGGQPTGSYMFRMGEMKWLSSFRFLLTVPAPVVFRTIMAFWNVET